MPVQMEWQVGVALRFFLWTPLELEIASGSAANEFKEVAD
jgi:hypothetical protein